MVWFSWTLKRRFHFVRDLANSQAQHEFPVFVLKLFYPLFLPLQYSLLCLFLFIQFKLYLLLWFCCCTMLIGQSASFSILFPRWTFMNTRTVIMVRWTIKNTITVIIVSIVSTFIFGNSYCYFDQIGIVWSAAQGGTEKSILRRKGVTVKFVGSLN